MHSRFEEFKRKISNIDMTTGTPWKKLLIFTVPLLVGNFFQQLYSTADMIILGQFVGEDAIAAVGASIPIFFLLMVLMMGISIGAGVLVSQYFGAKRRDELSHTIGAAITLTTILGALMMAFGPPVTRVLLSMMDTPAEILDDSVLYMNILLWGVLGMAYFNIFSGILRGLGDAFSPLLYLAIASVLNIGFNFLFIGWLGWGVWGAAIGTVVAQGLTSVLCLRRMLQMRDVFDMGVRYLRPNRTYMGKVLKLGVPTGISQAVFAVAMMIVQPLVNGFGLTFIAVNVIIMRIDGFVMMPNFSFGNAMTVFAGQNMGAGKQERIRHGMTQCAAMALGTAIVLVGAILLFGQHIAGLFIGAEAYNRVEIIEWAMQMLRILAIGYIVFSLNMVLLGVIRGAGDAATPLWGSVLITLFIRLPSAFLLVHFLDRPEALYYSLLLGWFSHTVFFYVAYRLGRWRKMGVVKHDARPVNTAALGEFSDYTYTVIFARYRDKWLYCRAKQRQTFETAGGRIEPGETPTECAARELREETGATSFDIEAAFDYEVGEGSYGQVFYAEIHELSEPDPDFEMAETRGWATFPPSEDLRFPHILPVLFRRMQRWMSDRAAPDEPQDIFDENRQPLGFTRRRGETKLPHEYVMVAIVWIRDAQGRFLITRRAPAKGYPLMWEFQGGAATAGDDSITAAIREAAEETGLILLPENGKLIHTCRTDGYKRAFFDTWLFTQPFSLNDVHLQEGETIDARLATIPEIHTMIATGDFLTNDHMLPLLNSL
jgi:putative MATE family efflux protein